MSESRPTVGDVWVFNNEPSSSAVIVSELAGANGFQLMARLGRIINVSRPSLRHMWTYTGISYQGPCSIGGCLLSAGVHVRGEWFCGPHAPRNQALGLPGDSRYSVVEQPVNGALDRCPNCHTDRDANSARTVIEEMTVHRCSCRARWIALLAQGVPEDGINLGEDLQAAHDLLENELCSPIRAFVGQTALSALRRTFREIERDNPTFAGIPLIHSFQYGNDTILLVGSPVASHDDEADFEKLLGTFWRHREWYGLICRVYGVEEATRGDRTVQIVHWDDEAQVLALSEEQLLQDFGASESPTKTVFENGNVSVQLPAEYVGDISNLPRLEVRIDEPGILTSVEVADASDKQPYIGETWWNVTTGLPVQVFGVGRTQTGLEFTRVTYGDGTAGRQLTGDFTRYHSFNEADELNLVVGNEYVRSDDTVWTLRSIDLPVLTLEGPDGSIPVRISEFRARYRSYVRRSAMDRLLDEEDLV